MKLVIQPPLFAASDKFPDLSESSTPSNPRPKPTRTKTLLRHFDAKVTPHEPTNAQSTLKQICSRAFSKLAIEHSKLTLLNQFLPVRFTKGHHKILKGAVDELIVQIVCTVAKVMKILLLVDDVQW
ncbi:hypothetical protein HK096_010813 [Nowakowskiella sp. JEL0078]|nr:hypothetical protein HK096_010813 [Nowakowskiella sp. JEL0078]